MSLPKPQLGRHLYGRHDRRGDRNPLTGLEIGLPLESVRPLIGNAFVDPDGSGDAEVDAINRRGRPTRVRVTCTSFRSSEATVGGALLLMEVLG